MFDIKEVTGIAEYVVIDLMDKDKKIGVKYCLPEGKAFLVVRWAADGSVKTVEVRTDRNLAKTLSGDYESVMESRYFGRGGIEIVMSGQLKLDEVYDLVRLSYNMSKEIEE